MAVTVIVDDQSKEINYLCPVSKQQVSGAYFNNTWTSIESTDCSHGWFEHTFNGISVEVVVATTRLNENYTVKLDDGPWTSQAGWGRYKSPILLDGQHTVTYGVGTLDLLPTFDYIAITAGPSTPLQNRTLIVDDTDPSLVYTGSWAVQPPTPLLLDFSTSLFRNTSHWSSVVGDTIEFQFTGTSVSVVGIVASFEVGGNISATYTIDHDTPVLQFIPENMLKGMPMAELFHADVEAGTHTLVINTTQIPPSMAIGIDFIRYNASFENLASMPDHSQSTETHSSSRSNVPVGAKIGGVLGGVTLLVVVLLLAIIWRRRGVRKDSWSELRDPHKTQWLSHTRS